MGDECSEAILLDDAGERCLANQYGLLYKKLQLDSPLKIACKGRFWRKIHTFDLNSSRVLQQKI